MATEILIARVKRTRIRFGTDEIKSVEDGGTVVDLEDPQVKKGMVRFLTDIVVLESPNIP